MKRRIFKGFCLEQEITIEFDRDNALLGRILQGLSRKLPQANIQVSFSINDCTTARYQALEYAIKDAMAQIEIIARTTGAKVSHMECIETENAFRDGYERVYSCASASLVACDDIETLNLTPSTITITQGVSMRCLLEEQDAG